MVSIYKQIITLRKISVKSEVLKNLFGIIKSMQVGFIITDRQIFLKSLRQSKLDYGNFYKMTRTVKKMFYNKQRPKVIHYKKCEDFSNEIFAHELERALSKFFETFLNAFKTTVKSVL